MKPRTAPRRTAARERRAQMLVRVPKELHRALKHAAVDRETSLNELVLNALDEWWQVQPERRRY
jgi:predicted HicB family RNase H-like nuclease